MQIRTAPDGTKQNQVNLSQMYQDLAVGDQVAFSFADKAETILRLFLFTAQKP